MTEQQNTNSNNIQTENIVKRILTSEVKYAISVIIFIVGVVAPYYDIKTEIALIKQNHLAHIETMSSQIERNSAAILKIQETEFELMQVIAKDSVRLDILEK